MRKASRGRGGSAASVKQTRSTSTGRVKKPKQNIANTAAAITIRSDRVGEIDPNLLHPGYRPRETPPRSPVRTRGRAALAGSSSNQVNVPKPSGSKSTGGISTSNEFEILSGEEGDDVDISSDDDDDGPECKAKEKNKTGSNERRPPPIYCVGHLADNIDELLEGHQYCLKLGKTSVQVITLDKKNFAGVQSILKKNGIKFYTFSHVEDTPVKIVLQGYKDRDISELEENLHGVKVRPREIKVLSRKTTETGIHTLYLLYFDRGAVKIQDLRRIKALDGFWVTWRFYAKHPTDAAQCHRCQQYGHGSRNCNLQPRCVKCGEAHLSEACSLPRKAHLGDNAEQTKPRIKCANCGGNHTSNYRGCAARKTYLEEQEKKKKKSAASRHPQQTTSATVPADDTTCHCLPKREDKENRSIVKTSTANANGNLHGYVGWLQPGTFPRIWQVISEAHDTRKLGQPLRTASATVACSAEPTPRWTQNPLVKTASAAAAAEQAKVGQVRRSVLKGTEGYPNPPTETCWAPASTFRSRSTKNLSRINLK